MTAKEKAKELFDKFYFVKDEDGYHSMNKYRAKQCALICVDGIILNEFGSDGIPYEENNIYYWQEVKEEINKL